MLSINKSILLSQIFHEEIISNRFYLLSMEFLVEFFFSTDIVKFCYVRITY